MATTGTRTVHIKGDSPVIHWANAEWRPTQPTAMQAGDRVQVGNRLTGDLNVQRDIFTLMEIWEKVA